MQPLFIPPLTAQAVHAERQFAAFEQLTPVQQETVLRDLLNGLARHAVELSPYWRKMIGPISNAGIRLADLPILKRADVQENFANLRARSQVMKQEKIVTMRTSGSTGRPVEVEVFLPHNTIIYQALLLRDYYMHQRDARKPIAVIKDEPDGELDSWGQCFTHLGLKGRVFRANLIKHDPEALLVWLRDKQPAYLSTTPAMALRLADIAISDSSRRTEIKEILTFGEVAKPELREAAARAFGARVCDRYSCEEVGWIALQCPHGDHLHALSMSTIVEIVDETGKPCRPGEPGRVLLTHLHGRAMPLFRYEVGDIAEWGEDCGCGIRLPVISRIWGRQRSFVRLPDGSQRLARLTGEYWRRKAPVRQYRVVQYADGLIEAFVVAERPLVQAEVAALKLMLIDVLGHPFEIIITQTERIDWGSRWKREDVAILDRLRHEV